MQFSSGCVERSKLMFDMIVNLNRGALEITKALFYKQDKNITNQARYYKPRRL